MERDFVVLEENSNESEELSVSNGELITNKEVFGTVCGDFLPHRGQPGRVWVGGGVKPREWGACGAGGLFGCCLLPASCVNGLRT